MVLSHNKKEQGANCASLTRELSRLSNPKRAIASAWYFKTGPGQYGHGDQFLGITVPAQRRVALAHLNLAMSDIAQLLKSTIHEHRFVALEILVAQYERGNKKTKKDIASFYLKNCARINNWDLVDTSAPYILGDYLLNKNTSLLRKLAASKNIWSRRIAIVSTNAFIQRGKYQETLAIAAMLLSDSHDLIHKAAGWMLREIGKKSLATELAFLDAHYTTMPRTMLRYAIERLPNKLRQHYLKKPNKK